MRNAVFVLTALLVAAAACVASTPMDADPGIYGPIDLAKFPRPQLLNHRPIVASPPAKRSKAKPLYLHVPPGHEQHWHAHCQTYDACSVPVYFVTEGWFLNVYLPAIGEQDGREQRYRIQMGRERDIRRDIHNVRADD
jgi:hypothetical protein